VAALVATLLLHEAGHYVAMRLFGYRDLRVFFIPFLGAAVSGRAQGVAGWKLAVVALAGPLPGIFLGAGLGLAGVVAGNARLVQLAGLMVAVNAFNLLPIMPLDGGRVLEAVLFGRHHLLRTGFHVAAALGLLAAGFHDWWFGVVGAAVLIGVPGTYRVGRIVRDLRRQGVTLTWVDGALPTPLAQLIIDHVTAAFPMLPTPRVAAQWTLQVVDALDVRPPRALASVGLVGAQAFGLMFALVIGVILTLAAPAARFAPPAWNDAAVPSSPPAEIPRSGAPAPAAASPR
jgi:membrane-associated protease RseP (regulator of RpoE activity)